MGGARAEATPTEANRQNDRDGKREREWEKEREESREKEKKLGATKGGGAVKSSVQSQGSDESSARGWSQQLGGGGCVWEQVVVGGQWNVRCLNHLP